VAIDAVLADDVSKVRAVELVRLQGLPVDAHALLRGVDVEAAVGDPRRTTWSCRGGGKGVDQWLAPQSVVLVGAHAHTQRVVVAGEGQLREAEHVLNRGAVVQPAGPADGVKVLRINGHLPDEAAIVVGAPGHLPRQAHRALGSVDQGEVLARSRRHQALKVIDRYVLRLLTQGVHDQQAEVEGLAEALVVVIGEIAGDQRGRVKVAVQGVAVAPVVVGIVANVVLGDDLVGRLSEVADHELKVVVQAVEVAHQERAGAHVDHRLVDHIVAAHAQVLMLLLSGIGVGKQYGGVVQDPYVLCNYMYYTARVAVENGQSYSLYIG